MIVIGKTLYSCCSGESDPIRIPGRRAAGWFGVDPPHLRWARGVAVRCAGVGEGLASSRSGTPVEVTCTCWLLC